MSLESVNICVDGYNIELPKGTGIKSYGITLVKALKELGACVDILCSRPVSVSNSVLMEALFFDQNIEKKNSPSITDLAKAIILQYIGLRLRAHRINLTDFVIKPEYDDIFKELSHLGSSIYNSSKIFTISNILKAKTGFSSQIYIDKKIDIWHSTYPLPLSVNRAKSVVTIHDLIPLRLPYSTLDDKKFYFELIEHVTNKSNLILSVSENTKEDLISIFKINPDKIHVTYQPVPNSDLSIDKDIFAVTMNRYKLNEGKYFLFVGAIEPKKNLGRLIQAYSRVDLSYPLVVVGKKGWLWENEIGELKTLLGNRYQNRIKFLNYVNRLDLIHLYNGAIALVFPSLYEGFGLPPIEAMYRGCPVITSNISSLPEICGDAALYVDPYSVIEIENAISRLASDITLRKELSIRGLLRAERFNMSNYLNNLESAYRLIL